MSDPRKVLHGWLDQLVGVLTGSRRRWRRGARERARQEGLRARAREARRRRQP